MLTKISENSNTPAQKSPGPWRNQREAANVAKDDLLCKAHGYFHVVITHGAYSYVTGTTPALYPSDRIVATYYYLAGRVWSHPRIINAAQSAQITRTA